MQYTQSASSHNAPALSVADTGLAGVLTPTVGLGVTLAGGRADIPQYGQLPSILQGIDIIWPSAIIPDIYFLLVGVHSPGMATLSFSFPCSLLCLRNRISRPFSRLSLRLTSRSFP
jgi:hypothetical protein